jgi:hypothetical protein
MWFISNVSGGDKRADGNPLARLAAAVLALLLALALQGCLTREADGDMPWATPQPWEGSVPLPSGMMRE